MRCQLVSEADHSLLFRGEEKTEKEGKRDTKIEEKRISKTMHSDLLWKNDRWKKKSAEDEGQAVNHSCRFSISALMPRLVKTWWCEQNWFPPLTNNKKQSLLCRGVKQIYPPPQLLSSLTISQRASFWGWEMERERTAEGEKTARQVHLPPTTANWSLSAIKSNNNNKIELSNVPPNAQPTQWLQQ